MTTKDWLMLWMAVSPAVVFVGLYLLFNYRFRQMALNAEDVAEARHLELLQAVESAKSRPYPIHSTVTNQEAKWLYGSFVTQLPDGTVESIGTPDWHMAEGLFDAKHSG